MIDSHQAGGRLPKQLILQTLLQSCASRHVHHVGFIRTCCAAAPPCRVAVCHGQLRCAGQHAYELVHPVELHIIAHAIIHLHTVLISW